MAPAPPDPAQSAPGPAFRLALDRAVQTLAIPLSPQALDRMARHFDIVLQANQSLNLTAIVDPRESAAKHYADSLAVLPLLDAFPQPGRAVDVGSGAGFPGIPLAIARPKWRLTLIEARRKKADFLSGAVSALELDNVEVAVGRSEDLARRAPFRDGFDVAVGRAIAGLATVAEILLPLVRPGGKAVAMKGPSEAWGPEADAALSRLGAGPSGLLPYELPDGLGRRSLAILPKVAPTPPGFPRRPGLAAKRPLF